MTTNTNKHMITIDILLLYLLIMYRHCNIANNNNRNNNSNNTSNNTSNNKDIAFSRLAVRDVVYNFNHS